MSEDEDEDSDGEDEVLEEVKNANISVDKKYGYHQSLQQFIVYLFGKCNKKTNAEMYKILHPDLLKDLKDVSGKGAAAGLRQVADKHL